MKKLPLLLLFLFSINCLAQHKLTQSIRNSQYTYYYKISDEDLADLYLHPDKKPTDRVLKQKVDSVLTKNQALHKPKLPYGNYVKVYATENRLMFTLIENRNVAMQMISQDKRIEFILTDRTGIIITDAIVTNNGKSVNYSKADGIYAFKPTKRNVVKVVYKGATNFYSFNQPEFKKSFFLTQWLKKLFSKKPKQKYYAYNQKADYPGFVVLNKPKFKPGDTVRLKTFIVDKKSKKPFKNKPVLVRLADKYGEEDFKTLATIRSYRPGMYEYSFVLTDSLDIDLDDTYQIILTDTKKLQKKNNDDEEELEESEKNYLQFVSTKFEYEEYELKGINFTMRADKETHQPGDTLNIYLKATDENGLPVPDGRVDLIVNSRFINNYKGKHVFLPDTLWKHTVQLDPLGETKVSLPDSIFPPVSMSYNIDADFLNASNEHRSQWKYLNYKAGNYQIKTKLDGDTLKIASYIRGKKSPLKATVFTISNSDTLKTQSLVLPANIMVDPYVSNYHIVADSAEAEFNLNSEESGISLTGERTADSAKVRVKSKRKLHFWYSIYIDDKLLERGEADSLHYKKPVKSNGSITVFAYYIWGGKLQTSRQSFLNFDKALKLDVQQPMSIYPGQKVTTELTVTDNKGKPVADADVTAWSLTSKFEEYSAPSVPYFGKFGKAPYFNMRYQNLRIDNTQLLELNWNRWSREIGLDTIEYYKFTRPDTIYTTTENTPDNITQIAPFVVKNGDIIPAHIVYIDNTPVYFSQTEDLKRYSFRLDSGMHDIRMRTSKMDIEVKDVVIAHGKKTIFSINADSTLKRFDIFINKAPDSLMNDEKRMLNNYLISVENTFKMQLATLQQGERVYLLNPEATGRSRQRVLTGPIVPNLATYKLRGKTDQNFIAETGYNYTFLPGLLKQKSFDGYPLKKLLSYGETMLDYTQLALTPTAIDTLWQNYLDRRSQTTNLFENAYIPEKNNGRLKIKLAAEEKHFIKNILIYKNNDIEFLKIYRGMERDFGNLQPGKYRLMFLLKGDEYFVQENIIIKPNGANLYTIALKPQPRDSVSIKINQVIQQRDGMYNKTDSEIRNDALLIKETFNEKYTDSKNFTGVITGTVIDASDKAPIPGVSILVKGTKHGAVTDAKGNFRLTVPKTGKITVAFIGYITEEFTIRPGDNYVLTLNQSVSQFQEVVVVGYGSQKKQSVTGAISFIKSEEISSSLQGKLAGVSIAQATPGSGYTIQIRGASTLTTGANPLVVIDGKIITEAEFKNMDPNDIGDISVLKDAAATAIYGARAANGVIIVTTKKKQASDEAEANLAAQNGGNTLRKNFKDYAYWQPRLTTDANGKARFTTVFPDDITNWRTFFIGISNNMETALVEGSIKSFKPVSASLITPQFAVEGDKMNIIGKVMNYNSTPATLQRTFSYNGRPLKQDSLSVVNSKIDTLTITASTNDSLTFEYAITRTNGYSDGEQRKIPVVKPGVQETKGVFEVLRGDTSVNLKFDAALGKVTLRAEASALPALLEETDKLREYRYLCNEQLASKLKGLLSEERIKKYLKQPFTHEKNIKEIIKKLNENKKGSGLWGWWKESDEELWISRHVFEALLDAEKAGYGTHFDKQKITQYLLLQAETYNSYDRLNIVELLLKLGAKADYKKYIAAIQKEQSALKNPSAYNRYRLMLIQQKAGLTVNTGELLSSKKNTMFGNVYWGEHNSYAFFDNSVQLTILAYNIIKNSGKNQQLLDGITGYLLEQRRDGGWRNTYESSLILETILPDLMKEKDGLKPSRLVLTGGKNQTVTTFPYSATFDSQPLNISKTGTLPVYITGYQQYWNSKPDKVSKDFTVNTWFENNGEKTTKLKGGKRVTLMADVTARADGEFVMIEIPIPAGCSYDSKEQSWRNNEIHREYFKEKVSIFCRKLKQGQYKFEVELMPRYDGEYTLNPAKAELMYFPVFYGRESLKKVSIGGN